MLTNCIYSVAIRSYLVESLKRAIEISKINAVRIKLVTKYHYFFELDSKKSNEISSNPLTKFHKDSYKEHVLELASDLSTEEQVISSEILAEPGYEHFNESNVDDENIAKIEDLEEQAFENRDYKLIPEGSRVSKLLLLSGKVVETTYLTRKGEKIIIFN